MPFNKPSMIWVMEAIMGGARQNRVQYTVTPPSFLRRVLGFWVSIPSAPTQLEDASQETAATHGWE